MGLGFAPICLFSPLVEWWNDNTAVSSQSCISNRIRNKATVWEAADLLPNFDMSRATKKKHVTKEVLDDYVVPDENQQIVKVRIGPNPISNSEQSSFVHVRSVLYDIISVSTALQCTCLVPGAACSIDDIGNRWQSISVDGVNFIDCNRWKVTNFRTIDWSVIIDINRLIDIDSHRFPISSIEHAGTCTSI